MLKGLFYASMAFSLTVAAGLSIYRVFWQNGDWFDMFNILWTSLGAVTFTLSAIEQFRKWQR